MRAERARYNRQRAPSRSEVAMPVNDQQLADEIMNKASQNGQRRRLPPPLRAHEQSVLITLVGPRRQAESGTWAPFA